MRMYQKKLAVEYQSDESGGRFLVIRRGLAFTFRVRLDEAIDLADRLVDIVEEVSD